MPRRMIGVKCELYDLYHLSLSLLVCAPMISLMIINAHLGQPNWTKFLKMVPILKRLSSLNCESF